MSLSMTLYDKDEKGIVNINWLRNPFGLYNWAEDNVGELIDHEITSGESHEATLRFVCNHWNYDKSNNINRSLFQRTVLAYWKEIQKLERGYYYFSISNYRQFVETHVKSMPGNMDYGYWHIDDSKYIDHKLAIPVEHFNDSAFNLSDPSLKGMKNWFARLVEFAELLQNDKYTFYCSN